MSGAGSIEEIVRSSLARIGRHDPRLNCFTTVMAEAALAAAADAERRRAQGRPPRPLEGVPFAVKNLYDVAGVTTLAGSRVLAAEAAAGRDATVVARLREAGAILVGCCNMDEFAYGFATENAHYGTTANPHDLHRLAGGSSGGSAAAVAAGLVPLSLGSDTNGSIRVPASLCGVYGLKPSFGRLSRAGVYPFVGSLDHAGAFARTVATLAAAYDAMQGPDPRDASQADRAPEPAALALSRMPAGLRIGRLVGWFTRGAAPEALAAVARVAATLGGAEEVELPGSEVARSAAFCMTAAEGGALHLARLRTRAAEYDPAVRERLIAGALQPASVLAQAQRVRAWYRREVADAFARFDVLLAAATPSVAPLAAQATILVEGREMPARANLGLYTQPISFAGLPVVSVPVLGTGTLPIGVQVITRPFAERLGLQVAARLEAEHVTSCAELDYA